MSARGLLGSTALARVVLVVVAFGSCAAKAADPAGQPRGVVRAAQTASISTELQVRVAAVHFREGQAFKAGQKLIEFDCRKQHAAVEAAQAQLKEMHLGVEKFRFLARLQSAGKNELDVAEARASKAAAELAALRVQIDQCAVVAPFNGRVAELGVQVHETTQPGRPFLSIVSASDLEIDILVPSDWAGQLHQGLSFRFRVDEAKQVYDVTVLRSGAVVDPISQTLKMVARFSVAPEGVLPGMSGTAEFPSGSIR